MIGILLHRDNPGMVVPLPVKAFVVAAIVRQHGSAESVSTSQNLNIGSAGLSILLSGKHVMRQQAQLFHHRERKILVGVKQHCASLDVAVLFVRLNVAVDSIMIGSCVLPGGLQISLGERWIGFENAGV